MRLALGRRAAASCCRRWPRWRQCSSGAESPGIPAKWAVAAFLPVAPAALPRADSIEVSGSVLVFSCIMLALTGGAAGLLPAIQSWRARAASVTIGSRSATASRQARPHAQCARHRATRLSLPLLVGAAALSRSFSGLMRVDPGFGTENVLSLHMAIPRGKYESDEQNRGALQADRRSRDAVPGVISAGMVNRLPLAGNNFVLPFELEGAPGSRSTSRCGRSRQSISGR